MQAMKDYADFFFDKQLSTKNIDLFRKVWNDLADGVEQSLKFYLRVVLDVHAKFAETPEESVNMVPILMFFEFGDAVDGIENLVRHGRAKAAIPLVRQTYEISVLLQYITQDQATYEQRCHAYEYWHLMAELANPFLAPQKKALVTNAMASPNYDQVKAEIARMEAEAAAKAKPGSKKFKVQMWYWLWGGPRSLEQIVTRLGAEKGYKYYRAWSKAIHGAGAVDRLVNRGVKQVMVKRLRSTDGLYGVARSTLNLTMALGEHLGKFYVPDKMQSLTEYIVKNVFPALAVMNAHKHIG
jgi:hypothetical protein